MEIKPKIIRGILIDTTKHTCNAYELHYADYTSIVRACACTYITCVTRNFANVIADVYCDDEALLKSSLPPVAIFTMNNNRVIEQLFGNCFICSHTKNGDIKSLTAKEIKHILDKCKIKNSHCLICRV